MCFSISPVEYIETEWFYLSRIFINIAHLFSLGIPGTSENAVFNKQVLMLLTALGFSKIDHSYAVLSGYSEMQHKLSVACVSNSFHSLLIIWKCWVYIASMIQPTPITSFCINTYVLSYLIPVSLLIGLSVLPACLFCSYADFF